MISAGHKLGTYVNQTFDYFRCADCNFLFVSPFLGPEVYTINYYNGSGPDPYVDYATEYDDYRGTDRVLEFRDLARVAEAQIERSTDPVNWLDFGCGSGGFLKFLRDKRFLSAQGADRKIFPCGHDVGQWADRLKNNDQFSIYTLEELRRLPANTFDIISMIEVLEHIPYPQEPLSLATHLLKPGGLLLLTTGNLSSPVAKKKGLNYRYCVSEIHISLFDPVCLKRAYHGAGLAPIDVRYRGVVDFKAIKTVRGRFIKTFARLLVKIPGVTRLIDHFYGVSAMPCARKPYTAGTV